MSKNTEYKAKRRQPDLNRSNGASSQTVRCEAVVVPGLEDVACAELSHRLGAKVRIHKAGVEQPLTGSLTFDYTGDLRVLSRLRAINAVFLVYSFAVPRPRALLGNEHFRTLLQQITFARSFMPAGACRTLYLGAAGADSAVMTRLKQELAQHSGLAVAHDEGDLLIRLRRSSEDTTRWEVLIRLSPRPLATRSWRVCNMEGALNATVAHAMVVLSHPRISDVFLNIACGSGTCMIERLAYAPARRVIGCDTNLQALNCARANLTAAKYTTQSELHAWDARALPLPTQSVDAICADLPFGNLIGSHQENLALYPLFLSEAARVARPGASFIVITHEVHLMETLLATIPTWAIEAIRRIDLGGLHPRIFVLRRCN